MAERRRRHPRVARVDAHVDAVRDEHLDGAALGGQRQPVRVAAEEQRAADALRVAVVDDRLRGREDVVLVEARAQRRSAVAARAERDALLRDGGIRLAVVVGVDQLVDVDQVGCFGGLSCACSCAQSAASALSSHRYCADSAMTPPGRQRSEPCAVARTRCARSARRTLTRVAPDRTAVSAGRLTRRDRQARGHAADAAPTAIWVRPARSPRRRSRRFPRRGVRSGARCATSARRSRTSSRADRMPR